MRIRHLREGTKMKGKERMEGGGKEGRKQESKEARKEGVKKQEKEGRRQRTKRSTRKEEEWKRSVFRDSALRITRGCKAACKNSQPLSLGTLFDTDVLWNLFERHPKSNQKKYSRAPSALCNSFAKRRQSAWRPTKGSKRVLLQTQTAALKSQSENHTGTDSWPKILLPTVAKKCPGRPSIYRAPGDTEDSKANGMKTAQLQLHTTQLPHPWQEKVAFAKPTSAFYKLPPATFIQRTSTAGEVLW